ncbi:MAG: RimK family protein [Balneolaceae bacterium]|nr:RimK family protein [Balneolaceae bacterium]
MRTLVIVDNPGKWELKIPEIELVAAKSYLTDPQFSKMKNARVFNMCRSYRYQSTGYYVSLLALARGHKPVPDVLTILDLRSSSVIRVISGELERLMQRSLAPIQSDRFTLSIYFGKNLAKRYDRLSQQLFLQFRAPFLRAQFKKSDRWHLQSITTVSANEIPEDHREFAVEKAREYFAGHRRAIKRKKAIRFDLAILVQPGEPLPPSDERALQRFTRAAGKQGFFVERITREDYGRLAEFDALFIRTTTHVTHFSYQFARKATAEGLVVIDDPGSILRCSNKVYLAELLERYKISIPKTLIVDTANQDRIKSEIGLPCILKQPDSSFSRGVVKVETEPQLDRALTDLFAKSDLIIAQEFLPTPFDWRIGILNRKPLYACKYFMARNHWQIYGNSADGRTLEGKSETLALSEVPPVILRLALDAANLVGEGLYGVDVKEVNGRGFVIEVNDNPSIDAGVEDAVLKEELYRAIIQYMASRLEESKRISGRKA